MKKNIKKYYHFLFLFLVFFLFSPLLANGVGLYTPQPQYNVITQEVDVLARLAIIITYVYDFLFIAATVFFLISLYGYLTAGGDSNKIKKVTNQLLFAVLAMVGGLFSFAITKIIEGILK